MIELTKEEFEKVFEEFDDLYLSDVGCSNIMHFKLPSTADRRVVLKIHELGIDSFGANAFNKVERWVKNNLRGPKAKGDYLSKYAVAYKLSEPFRDAEEILVTMEDGSYAAWDTKDWTLLEHKDAQGFDDFMNQIGYEVEW